MSNDNQASNEEIKHCRQLIDARERRKKVLELQLAEKGSDAEPHIVMELETISSQIDDCRKKIEEISTKKKDKLTNNEREVPLIPSAPHIFYRDDRKDNEAETEKLIKLARRKIIVQSTSLDKLLISDTPEVTSAIRLALGKGCSFTFISPSPENPLLEYFDKLLGVDQQNVSLRRRVKNCLDAYQSRLNQFGISADRFVIRLTDGFIPPYRLMLIDPDLAYAKCRVEMFLYGEVSTLRPTFLIKKKNHKQLYQIYYSQYQRLLEETYPFSLD
ncbi:MAG: hypothetical protein MUD01_02645 [Chloroflexaceae bacterium]|nr:hypothetical protein [Chloroflexaceae bacterium]